MAKITFLGSLTLTLMSPCKGCSRDILRQVCCNPLAFQHYIIYASYSLFVLFLLPGKEPDVAAWRVILLHIPVFPNHTQEWRMHVYAYMNSDKTELWFLSRTILYFDFYNHLHQLTKITHCGFPRKQLYNQFTVDFFFLLIMFSRQHFLCHFPQCSVSECC